MQEPNTCPEVLIVVPARGGSKGLRRKNLHQIGDRSLIHWAHDAVNQSKLDFSFQMILSTDDQEIADMGRDIGFDVPFLRPAPLASDTASAESVLLHSVEWFESSHGKLPKYSMWLQPTSPFRIPEAFNHAYRDLEVSSQIDSIIGVKPIPRSLWMIYRADEDMNLEKLDASVGPNTARQKNPVFYTPNGALYVIRTERLLATQTLTPEHTRGLVMDPIADLDIDHPLDLEMARALNQYGIDRIRNAKHP